MTGIPLCPQATHPKAWNFLCPEGSSLDSSPFLTPPHHHFWLQCRGAQVVPGSTVHQTEAHSPLVSAATFWPSPVGKWATLRGTLSSKVKSDGCEAGKKLSSRGREGSGVDPWIHTPAPSLIFGPWARSLPSPRAVWSSCNVVATGWAEVLRQFHTWGCLPLGQVPSPPEPDLEWDQPAGTRSPHTISSFILPLRLMEDSLGEGTSILSVTRSHILNWKTA